MCLGFSGPRSESTGSQPVVCLKPQFSEYETVTFHVVKLGPYLWRHALRNCSGSKYASHDDKGLAGLTSKTGCPVLSSTRRTCSAGTGSPEAPTNSMLSPPG